MEYVYFPTWTHHFSANPLGFPPFSILSWKVVSFFNSFMQSLNPSDLASFCGVFPSELTSLAGHPGKQE